MTRPSRVKATALPTLAAVNVAQAAEPSESKSSIDDPLAGVAGLVPALASVIFVPSTTDGPSRYLSVPSSLQVAT